MNRMKREKIIRLIDSSGFLSNIRVLFGGYNTLEKDSYFTELLNDFEKFILESNLINEVIDVYEDIFTEEEIEEAIVWNESSTGRKFVENYSKINDSISPFITSIVEEFVKKVLNSSE